MSDETDEWFAHVVTPENGITKLRQVHPHRPDEGIIGDCYRTSIACAIGLDDPAEVPHFIAERISTGDLPWEERRLARHWLRSRDMDLLVVEREQADELGVPYILSVESKSGRWKHVVVAQSGEVIHDPMGSDDYTLADQAEDTTVEIITRPYLPEPDEMVRRWRERFATAEVDP